MKNIVIGMAGHIDHGKTALVECLTGKNTDTLPEEKKRGITVDIGFSYLDLDGDKVGIVDVPGHEKFIKNMVAGVLAINYVMMVIAADDGIMPQTKEHFEIIKLLNIKNGMVILTKTDLVQAEVVEQRKKEIREFFKGSFLENSLIVESSIKNKDLISNLKNYLMDDIKRVKEENTGRILDEELDEKFRMYIDRVFSIKGFGTIVTGTLLKGKININDNFYIYPHNLKGKIKGIENHGEKLDEIHAGNRCALNLSQADKNLIKRGNIISSNDNFPSSNIVDIIFIPLKNKKVKNNQRIRLHIGTREIIGRIKFFSNDLMIDNQIIVKDDFLRFPAQLFLEEEITAFYSELGIIRNFSPMDTIGGIKILNVFGEKTKKNNVQYIQKLLDLDKGKFENEINYSLILKDILKKFHESNYANKGIERLELKNIYFKDVSFKEFKNILEKNTSQGIIKIEKNLDKEYILLKNFKVKLTKDDKQVKEKIFKMYKESGLIPLKRSIIEKEFEDKSEFEKIHNYLFEENMIIYLGEDFYILKGFFKEIQKIIAVFFENNNRLKISDLKKIVNLNREIVILILNKLDNIKFTKRINDYRILNKERKDDN